MENIPTCPADFLKIPIGIGTSKHGGFGHVGNYPLARARRVLGRLSKRHLVCVQDGSNIKKSP